MTESAFLDKGILLGYCFSVDVHHEKCSDYLLDENRDPYITEYVRKSFNRKKVELIRRHRKDILHHVDELENSRYTGELGPMELKRIRQNMISNVEYPNAWRYLRDYYDDQSLISVGEITEEMRELARRIESNALSRFKTFDRKVNHWERNDEHVNVQTSLDEIRNDDEEDFWICIDAHDVASRVSGHTELATTDLNHLVRNGRKELIVDNTDLEDVVPVAVTSSI